MGFYVSTKQALIIVLLFALIVTFVGLMAGLIRATPDEIVYPEDPDPTTTTTTGTTTTGNPSDSPWLDPFLPSFSKPVHYNLWLYPDFYELGNSFTGRIDIEIDISANTNYLIVHCKAMDFMETLTRVSMKDGAALTVVRQFGHLPHEFWVVEVAQTITAGSTVMLHLEFGGSLVNGIVGFYKSNYTNTKTGKER